MESEVPPLTLDELTALENIPDGRPPQEVRDCVYLSESSLRQGRRILISMRAADWAGAVRGQSC